MTSMAAKYVSKRFLGETLTNKWGQEDLYFETVPASRIDGVPSKKKTERRRKADPPGITAADAKVLTKVKRRAYRLDMSLFNFCGIRFGWSSVVGIIPVIGDFIDVFMALMVVRSCNKVEGGLPNAVRLQMMFNVALDFAVGLVPFLGDLADAVFRANTRNALLLEKHLRQKGAKKLKAEGRPIGIDPTDPDEFDKMERQLSDDEPPRQPPRPGRTQHEEDVSIYEAGGRQRNSWFGYGQPEPRTKQYDPERGHAAPATRETREAPARTKVKKGRR